MTSPSWRPACAAGESGTTWPTCIGSAGYIGGNAGGTPWPGTSNVNVSPSEVRANMLVVPVGTNGGISLTTFQVADVAVDVHGV